MVKILESANRCGCNSPNDLSAPGSDVLNLLWPVTKSLQGRRRRVGAWRCWSAALRDVVPADSARAPARVPGSWSRARAAFGGADSSASIARFALRCG
jgi:hypothetical protein